MKISLATNFDDNLIEKIKPYNVYELYGKFKKDILGGGRPVSKINEISKEKFECHVKLARQAGINFNYLFNGACTENLEQNGLWREEFKKFVLYLKSVGVNAFTITSPLILQIIKKIYPEAICRVSTFACVNSVQKVKYWEDLGADIICADFTTINRDLKLLQEMVKSLKKAKIEILATNSCIKYCPYIHTHTNCISHSSLNNSNYIDWCLYMCQYKEMCNIEEYIKSPWVRPEDIKYYEEIGIEHFKITERDFPTEILLKRLDAYSKRKYNGNLLDLIQGHGYQLQTHNEQLIKKTKFTNVQEILHEIHKVRGYKQERIYDSLCYIDNAKLNNFLDFFVKDKCLGNCENCNYCKTIADKTIIKNEDVLNYLKSLYKLLFEKLTNGDIQ